MLWNVLIDASVAEENGRAIVEYILGSLVHVTEQLQHQVLVSSKELDLQSRTEPCKSITILYIVLDEQKKYLQDKVVEVIKKYPSNMEPLVVLGESVDVIVPEFVRLEGFLAVLLWHCFEVDQLQQLSKRLNEPYLCKLLLHHLKTLLVFDLHLG